LDKEILEVSCRSPTFFRPNLNFLKKSAVGDQSSYKELVKFGFVTETQARSSSNSVSGRHSFAIDPTPSPENSPVEFWKFGAFSGKINQSLNIFNDPDSRPKFAGPRFWKECSKGNLPFDSNWLELAIDLRQANYDEDGVIFSLKFWGLPPTDRCLSLLGCCAHCPSRDHRSDLCPSKPLVGPIRYGPPREVKKVWSMVTCLICDGKGHSAKNCQVKSVWRRKLPRDRNGVYQVRKVWRRKQSDSEGLTSVARMAAVNEVVDNAFRVSYGVNSNMNTPASWSDHMEVVSSADANIIFPNALETFSSTPEVVQIPANLLLAHLRSWSVLEPAQYLELMPFHPAISVWHFVQNLAHENVLGKPRSGFVESSRDPFFSHTEGLVSEKVTVATRSVALYEFSEPDFVSNLPENGQLVEMATQEIRKFPLEDLDSPGALGFVSSDVEMLPASRTDKSVVGLADNLGAGIAELGLVAEVASTGSFEMFDAQLDTGSTESTQAMEVAMNLATNSQSQNHEWKFGHSNAASLTLNHEMQSAHSSEADPSQVEVPSTIAVVSSSIAVVNAPRRGRPRKQETPRVESQVKRCTRQNNNGYNYQALPDQPTRRKNSKVPKAVAPAVLQITEMQRIGVEECQIDPDELTEERLLQDRTE
jgi:hypothetical protein